MSLRVLDLSSTGIADPDIEPLAGLTDLEELYVDDTALTDGCLRHLVDLPALREISFKNTLITASGMKRFERERQGRRGMKRGE